MAGLSRNAAHQVVDAGFVGRLGAVPLAVLALLVPLASLVAPAGIGLGIGAASTTARALGATDPLRARQIAGIGFLAALFLALVLCGGLWAGREVALAALGTPGDLRPLAAGYLPVLSLTIGGATLQILCDFLAIGRGEVGMRLRTLALCFGLNIALDPLLIFGFGLGLNGAAWTTLTAQGVTLAVWAWWFRAPNRRPALGPLRLLAPVLRVGLPEAAAVAITTLGMMAVLRLAAETGGTEAVAALGIALRLTLIVILPLEGFAIGVQPVLAHAFGAAKPERAARVLRHLIARGLTLGTALALVFCLLARPMVRAMADLPTFHRWQNDPRVAEFFEEAGTLEQYRADLERLLADPHMLPVIATLDGRDFAYFELYWVRENRLGAQCDAAAWDRGWHVLVGEEDTRGVEYVTAWLPSLMHYMFLAEPRTEAILGEPKARHLRQLKNLGRGGFAHVRDFDFSHKRASLVRLERQHFFESRLWARPETGRGTPLTLSPARLITQGDWT